MEYYIDITSVTLIDWLMFNTYFSSTLINIYSQTCLIRPPLYNKSLSIKGRLIFPINEYNIVFNATFNNISAISRRPILVVKEAGVPVEPPTMGKQLVNFITNGWESSAPFL